jgi:hypothetical protein
LRHSGKGTRNYVQVLIKRKISKKVAVRVIGVKKMLMILIINAIGLLCSYGMDMREMAFLLSPKALTK